MNHMEGSQEWKDVGRRKLQGTWGMLLLFLAPFLCCSWAVSVIFSEDWLSQLLRTNGWNYQSLRQLPNSQVISPTIGEIALLPLFVWIPHDHR